MNMQEVVQTHLTWAVFASMLSEDSFYMEYIFIMYLK